ncbi:uncharacterized protein HD556DRAFT_1055673 [Suillus plorans]|uniref:G domain-containing protein n=1 Tax=Suillus plorans TaxID=116603 RepID=A0A9P7DC35_9AGAM|nr:uncharacterized protein HD556DRAFT_1055673 [Suillus plorans]KAG1786360.1 hypothetical protein HD556DRAFT_1055673 [Suillus plorans]
MDTSEIREKIGRFRILVVGRANAGKTTILQRVCNTRDDPEIHNSAGVKIDLAVIEASREVCCVLSRRQELTCSQRGLHDIENEMVFRSNPGFVFHDSRGFESGGKDEFEKVKEFIAGRSKEIKITNRLHAIWYCIPMDEAHRSFTAAEQKFFSECDTGTIPVIVVFTKFDALYDIAYSQLRKEGKSLKDARELAPKRAEETFPDGPQLKFLQGVRWPPKGHVCLPNCGALIERTAGTLNDEMLEQLFVSTQQTHLEICMRYAIKRTLPKHLDSVKSTTEGYKEIVGTLGNWFPHIYVSW